METNNVDGVASTYVFSRFFRSSSVIFKKTRWFRRSKFNGLNCKQRRSFPSTINERSAVASGGKTHFHGWSRWFSVTARTHIYRSFLAPSASGGTYDQNLPSTFNRGTQQNDYLNFHILSLLFAFSSLNKRTLFLGNVTQHPNMSMTFWLFDYFWGIVSVQFIVELSYIVSWTFAIQRAVLSKIRWNESFPWRTLNCWYSLITRLDGWTMVHVVYSRKKKGTCLSYHEESLQTYCSYVWLCQPASSAGLCCLAQTSEDHYEDVHCGWRPTDLSREASSGLFIGF